MNEANTKYSLDPMSDEQYKIYQIILNGENAIGDACAGSGKSTTILSIAQNIPSSQFIQLTYNSMLSKEIQTKVEKLNIENLKVYTFHSLVVKYYNSNGYNDSIIRNILLNNSPPRTKIPFFNVLVIDEAQDMTFLYFKLIVKFCKDMGEPIQLLILGDFMQGLYEFKGADTRFLTCADKIWNDFNMLKSNIFHKCTLKMSYRITEQMANFVNNSMLGEQRLLACKQGIPVVYLRRSTRDAEKYVIHKISSLLAEGAKPSDFFVLGGSVKGETSAIRHMENSLVENNIPCHVPMFETEKIDERVIEGKVVFSTFHSVKGRQRKYVFVIGFDNSYFKYFARNLNDNICPNTLYVACTRATHGLFVIERNNIGTFDRPLKFLKMNHHEMKNTDYIDFKGIPQTIFYTKNGEIDDLSNSYNMRERNGRKLPVHMTTPTDLIKFIPESVIEDISPILDSIFTRLSKDDEKEINISNVIKTKKGFYEDVADLNGIAIPMMYFEQLYETTQYTEIHNFTKKNDHGGKVLYNIIQNSMADSKPNEYLFLKKLITELPENCNSISDYLYLSNLYIAVKEKLYFKIRQIEKQDYDWINEEIIDSCFKQIHNIVGKECFYNDCPSFELEKTIIYSDNDIIHKKIDDFLCDFFPDELFRFSARIDLVTELSVWELKCTNTISTDHLLQVVIYAWLWRMVVENIEELENIRDFKIFNIKTGEIFRLDASTQQLNDIMILLLKGKYCNKEFQKDDNFISDCKSYISNNV